MLRNYKSQDVLPFVYSITIALAASAQGAANLTLASDSHFEFHSWLASTDQDAAATLYPNNFTCQITDTSSGRQLTNAKIPQRIMFGPSNQNPPARRPILFTPNAIIQFDFTSLYAGGTLNVVLAMHGYKIYNLAVA